MEEVREPRDVTFFDRITIKLASPQVIKSWSSGEIKKAETLNYRTLKPKKTAFSANASLVQPKIGSAIAEN